MQGAFITGSRPKTKKAFREAVEAINDGGDAYSVVLEATSMFGNEYDGSLANAPKTDKAYYIVGPNPYTSRKWYASLHWDGDKDRWVVK